MRKLKYCHVEVRAHTCKKLPVRDRMSSSSRCAVTWLMYYPI